MQLAAPPEHASQQQTQLGGGFHLLAQPEQPAVQRFAAPLYFLDAGAWYAIPTYLSGFEYNINYPFATFFYPIRLAD